MPFLTSRQKLQYKRDISYSSLFDGATSGNDLVIYKQIPFNKGKKINQEVIDLSSSLQGNASNVFKALYPMYPMVFGNTIFTLYDGLIGSIEKQAWYNFNDSSTVTTDSFGVASVEDISGKNNTATQVTDANKPSYSSGVLSFVNDTWLDINLDYLASTNHFAIAVLKRTAPLEFVYGAANGDNGSNSFYMGFRQNDPPEVFCLEFWDNFFRVPVVHFIFSEFNIVVWRWMDNSYREVRSNGFIEGSEVTNYGIDLPSGGGRLGSNVVERASNFDIKEIMFVTGNDVTDDNIQIAEGYLANKYSLAYKFPSGHPYV